MSTRFSPAGRPSGVAKQRACQMEGGPQTAFGDGVQPLYYYCVINPAAP
jgi:hypothetical protein